MGNLKCYCLLLFMGFYLSGQAQDRPEGKEVEEFLHFINEVSNPGGNSNEYYSLLSNEFIASFEQEIEKAKTMDSLELRSLPPLEMLRVLSLKNTMYNTVKQHETKFVILTWLESAKRGFPIKNSPRYYYSPKKSLEDELLAQGSILPQVLIVRENGYLKVNPFNTLDYQNKRLENILRQKSMEELIKDASWFYFQTHRTINWGPMDLD